MSSTKIAILSESAPKPIAPYSQAIKVGNTVYISGQLGFDVSANRLVLDSFEAQTEQVFKNLKAVAEASGGTLNDVTKMTIFITDFKNFAIVNKVMEKSFSQPFPARSTIGVASLPLGADIEIEAIMHLSDDRNKL